jgi:hypothetical protein
MQWVVANRVFQVSATYHFHFLLFRVIFRWCNVVASARLRPGPAIARP